MENNTESGFNFDDYEDMDLKEAQKVMVKILKDVHNLCEKHGIKYVLDAGTLLGAVRHKGFIPWDDDIDISMMRDEYERFLEIAAKELPDYLFLQTFETDPYYNIYPCPCKIRFNDTIFLEKGMKNIDPKMHNGIYIDVFPYDTLPKSPKKFKLQRTITENILMRSLMRIREMPDHLTFKNKITHAFYKHIVKKYPYEKRKKLYNKLLKWNDPDSPYVVYGLDTPWSKGFVLNREDYVNRELYDFEGEKFYGPKGYDAYLKVFYGDYMTLPKEEDRQWHAKTIKKKKGLKID